MLPDKIRNHPTASKAKAGVYKSVAYAPTVVRTIIVHKIFVCALLCEKDEHPKKLESSQRQDLIASIWKVIIAIGVVVVFDVIVFSIVPRQKYLVDFGFRTRANYFDFEQDEKVDNIFEIWEILRIGDPRHITSNGLKLNSP